MRKLHAGIVVVAAVVVTVIVIDHSGRDMERDDYARELAVLRADVTELSRSVRAANMRASRAELAARAAGLAARAAPLSQQPTAERTEVDESEPAAEPSPTEQPRQQVSGHEKLNRYHAHIDGAFQAGDAGTEWARDAVALARSRLAVTLPDGSELLGLDCRDTMCRIQTTHHNRGGFHEFVKASFFSGNDTVLWNGGSFSMIIDDAENGLVTAVSYLAPQGRSLPVIELE